VPKHRVVVVTVVNSPPSEIEFPPLEQADAQKIKNALDPAKGKTIVDVRIKGMDE
jgi:hypothetical protein